MRGVVAAGHPQSAEAGAAVLREGGNAVDAAVAAVLTSWVTESPLTGPGAGGFMLVHSAAGENRLLDFFVAAPGKGLEKVEPAALEPIDVHFSAEAIQVFNIGPSSCGVYGNPAGVAEALERFGTMPLSALVERPARAAREGVELTPMAAVFLEILAPILTATPEAAAIYAPEGQLLKTGDTIRMPDLGDLLERLGAEGPGFLYEGELAARVSGWVLERGGLLTEADLASYAPVDRDAARARYRGREVLTNPPPSSGGILIAYALDLLERLGRPPGVRTLIEVMDRTNRERTEEFVQGLHAEGYLERFLHKEALESAASELGSRLGSTTHLSVLDAEGNCASVTCSNGSCSGVVVPDTGIHLNNMLGEFDLAPGTAVARPGVRFTSMMSPSLVLREGRPRLVVGSAGSLRLRGAILQIIVNVVGHGLAVDEAIERPRLHLDDSHVHCEGGNDPAELDRLESWGYELVRWRRRNLFFGGAAGVEFREDGTLAAAGDARRGGHGLVVR